MRSRAWKGDSGLASRNYLRIPSRADDPKISLGIMLAEVIQQASTTADHSQQTAPCSVVLGMRSHVFGQAVNPCGQNGNLDFRGASIAVSPLEIVD